VTDCIKCMCRLHNCSCINSCSTQPVMEFTTMLELMPTLSEDPIRHNYNKRCIAADQGCNRPCDHTMCHSTVPAASVRRVCHKHTIIALHIERMPMRHRFSKTACHLQDRQGYNMLMVLKQRSDQRSPQMKKNCASVHCRSKSSLTTAEDISLRCSQ